MTGLSHSRTSHSVNSLHSGCSYAQKVLKRVSIRNRHSKYKSNPRVFDVVLIGQKVFFEVKTGKDQLERIPFEDVIEQVESAVIQEQHTQSSQRTTAT